MSNQQYFPRQGTKTAAAFDAMMKGPLSASALGKEISVPLNSISALLKAAITNGAITKLKNESGEMWFALKGQVIPEGLYPYDQGGAGVSTKSRGRALTAAPLVRSVSHPQIPTFGEFNPADPFRLAKRPAPPTPKVEVNGAQDAPTPSPVRIASLPEAHKSADPAPPVKLAHKAQASDKQVAGDHYKRMGVQPWDVVDTWPLEQRIGYYRGGALKYAMRMGTKDVRLQEAEKGLHYMEKLVEVLRAAGEVAPTSVAAGGA